MEDSMKKLVGCIQILNLKTIETRFIYVDTKADLIYNVTEALCDSIDIFNKALGKTKIPYTFSEGLAIYKNGHGLTHAFEPSIFKNIWTVTKDTLTFPLLECTMDIFTPDEIRDTLKCTDLYDANIIKAVLKHYKRLDK